VTSVCFGGRERGCSGVLRDGGTVPGWDGVVGVTVDGDVHASEGGGDGGELADDLELSGDGGLNLTHEGHGLRDIIFVTVHEVLIRVEAGNVRLNVVGNAGVYVSLGSGASEGGVDNTFKGLHQLMSVGVVVSAVGEELAEEVSDANVAVDVETHHFIDKIFRCVVCLIGDDKVVALKEDGHWEVAAKVEVFGETGEGGDVCNVGASGISTGSSRLEEFEEKVRDIEVEEEGLEFEEFRSVEEPSVSGGRGTSFEIADEVESVDNKEEVRDEGGRGNLGVLFDVEGVVKRGGVKA